MSYNIWPKLNAPSCRWSPAYNHRTFATSSGCGLPTRVPRQLFSGLGPGPVAACVTSTASPFAFPSGVRLQPPKVVLTCRTSNTPEMATPQCPKKASLRTAERRACHVTGIPQCESPSKAVWTHSIEFCSHFLAGFQVPHWYITRSYSFPPAYAERDD